MKYFKGLFNFLLILSLTTILVSCGESEEEKKENRDKEQEQLDKIRQQIGREPSEMRCLRWIDRDLYFGLPDPFISSKNNEFHRLKVQDVISEIQRVTRLGEGYFRQKVVNPDLLTPFQSAGRSWSDYKSFILIWPDGEFENLADQFFGTRNASGEIIFGSGLDSLVDKNAMTIVNQTFQRKFFMILRASCFDADTRCADASGNPIGDKGVSALIARQFSLLFNIAPVDCNVRSDDVMCPVPSNSQWETSSKERFAAGLNNALNSIEQNPNFYGDAEQASCLTRSWIDKSIFTAISEGDTDDLDNYYNGVFQKNSIKDAMNEIACNTLLGCNYFSFSEKARSALPITLDRQDSPTDSNTSFIQIWPDLEFNDFVLNEIGTAIPDDNAVTFINAAKKSNFQMLYRSSCFQQDVRCSGNNEGISTLGVKALVARQLGFAVGLASKNCSDFPNDIMCADLPDDNQWSEQSKFIYYNKLNNFLELTGNNPYFYWQYFEDNGIDDEDE